MEADGDMVAMIKQSPRGRLRFARSLPYTAKGGAVEAVRVNPTATVIPGVDAPKSTHPTTEPNFTSINLRLMVYFLMIILPSFPSTIT